MSPAAARPLGPSRQRGFTLIEILIVLALIGLATGVLWPRLGARTPSLDRAAAQLAGGLRAARETALAGGGVTPFDLDDAKALTPGAYEVEGRDLPLVFLPNGAASGGVFLLRAEDGRRRRVAVDYLTGRVSIEGAP